MLSSSSVLQTMLSSSLGACPRRVPSPCARPRSRCWQLRPPQSLPQTTFCTIAGAPDDVARPSPPVLQTMLSSSSVLQTMLPSPVLQTMLSSPRGAPDDVVVAGGAPDDVVVVVACSRRCCRRRRCSRRCCRRRATPQTTGCAGGVASAPHVTLERPGVAARQRHAAGDAEVAPDDVARPRRSDSPSIVSAGSRPAAAGRRRSAARRTAPRGVEQARALREQRLAGRDLARCTAGSP